LPEEVPVY